MRKLLFICSSVLFLMFDVSAQNKVQKWDVFELTLNGPATGNPYMGSSLIGRFTNGDKVYEQEGFYNGNGVYIIRFMPDKEGAWTYVTTSNKSALNNKKGSFQCVSPASTNHGPVRVNNGYHFKYEDGTALLSIWHHYL